jgi:hypothetical protein
MTATMTPFPNYVMPELSAANRMSESMPFPVIHAQEPSSTTARPSLPNLPPLPATGSVFSTNSTTSIVSSQAPPAECEASTNQDDYTDDDLVAALSPLVEKSIQQTGSSMETLWEPWLRSTLRRALAEQRALYEPQHEPSFFDHIAWRFQALFSERSYQELVNENTRRFRVEEVFLLEKSQGVLLSYASTDPSRHAVKNRVLRTVEHLANSLYDEEGTLRMQINLPRGRKAEVLLGQQCILIAVVLGQMQESIRVDFNYTLRRIEDRFGPRLGDQDEDLLLSVQPLLEDCLLIAAPLVTVAIS